MKVAQSCLILCDPMNYTVHGFLQARILEWVAFPFSRGSSQLRDWTQVSCIAGGFFTSWATREALDTFWVNFCTWCEIGSNFILVHRDGWLSPHHLFQASLLAVFYLCLFIWSSLYACLCIKFPLFIGLPQKFVRVFPYNGSEKSEPTFWPTQYKDVDQ